MSGRRRTTSRTLKMFQELRLVWAPAVTHMHHAQLSTPGCSDALTDEEGARRCKEGSYCIGQSPRQTAQEC